MHFKLFKLFLLCAIICTVIYGAESKKTAHRLQDSHKMHLSKDPAANWHWKPRWRNGNRGRRAIEASF